MAAPDGCAPRAGPRSPRAIVGRNPPTSGPGRRRPWRDPARRRGAGCAARPARPPRPCGWRRCRRRRSGWPGPAAGRLPDPDGVQQPHRLPSHGQPPGQRQSGEQSRLAGDGHAVDLDPPTLRSQRGPGVVQCGAATQDHQASARVTGRQLAGRFGVELQGVAVDAPPPGLGVVDGRRVAADLCGIGQGGGGRLRLRLPVAVECPLGLLRSFETAYARNGGDGQTYDGPAQRARPTRRWAGGPRSRATTQPYALPGQHARGGETRS